MSEREIIHLSLPYADYVATLAKLSTIEQQHRDLAAQSITDEARATYQRMANEAQQLRERLLDARLPVPVVRAGAWEVVRRAQDGSA